MMLLELSSDARLAVSHNDLGNRVVFYDDGLILCHQKLN